jgi:hypothetical protein
LLDLRYLDLDGEVEAQETNPFTVVG